MKTILHTFHATVLAAVLATTAHSAVITQFNFNSTVADANTGTGVTTASTGAGTASAIGGTSATFSSGSPGDSSSATDNSGFNLSSFPAVSTGSGTAGAQFTASTATFTDPIQLTLDFRQSGTASRFFQLLVTSDGTTYTAPSGGTATIVGPINSPNTATSFSSTGLYSNNSGSGSQQFVQGLQYTFANGSAFQNNANFGFRFVSVFDPTAGGTSYTGSNSTYSTAGTARFDQVTIGTAVPEPSAALAVLFGAGVLGIVGRLRRTLR